MKLYERVFYFIAGHGRGWAFTSRDLLEKYTRREADDCLKYLVEKGKIRRISRGLYDYPVYSDILEQYLSPDIDEVARAIARKFKWKIEISGDSALNMLGISTQVPGRYIYLTDGVSREYDIFGTVLEFKKSGLKEIGFKHKESSIVVQALKALGRGHITPEIIEKIRKQINPDTYDKILKDTKTVKNWVYEAVRETCREN